ncbi:biotin-dependent carboxyltransferase family protein [Rhizobium sp. TRM95111]|uniref:5-oxoprolinase subunit C family protein n=1 Tax=Rhizobium alarense TaxID=2846851 RepID=UPI001F47A526|nr:biotin-dependent carboxyltransferase family protein [Rhizobium alarense]MCF3640342.1 biotin-dependent carboxyltransferase family protein [Rhizobium alarense]
MIEVLSAAPLMTVQDLGRCGFYRYGVCRSGAMDRLALAVGNLLLGNDEGVAGLEIPLPPVKFAFREDVNFALTGADCAAKLDGRPVPPWWAMRAKAGQTLSLSPARSGTRAYLCLAGGVDVPEVLGSRSTQLREVFGGLEGRQVGKGDLIVAGGNSLVLPEDGVGALPPSLALALTDNSPIAVRVVVAAEYDHYTTASQDLFWNAQWEVTAQSNRAGFRLAGPDLELAHKVELRSHGVVPGVIQVPAGGHPIIQLADAATMGGYPKIGTVIEADLWRVGQAKAGDRLHFAEVSYEEGLDALIDVRIYLDDLRHQTARLREASRHWRQA